MKARFALVLASCVLLGAAMSPTEAFAQKKKIVVEAFKGPAAPKYRIAVMKSLYAAGFDVIPDKVLVKVEADLGLQSVSQSYAGISKELKLAGFVSGIITGGRRPKARVIVRDPSGKPIGGQIFQATSAPKLMAMVSAGSGPKVAAVLGGGGGGAPADDAPDMTPQEEKGGEPVAAAEEEEKEKPAKSKGKKKAKSDDEEAEGDADAEVADAAEEEEDEPSKKKAGGKNLRIAFVLRMFSRNFAYNQSVQGGQQGYQAPESKFNNLPLVPAPGLAIDFFPLSNLGVFASYNKALAGSKDSSGSVYTTTAQSWQLGAKGRFGLASVELEPSVAYGSSTFSIEPFKDKPNGIQVAPVDYRTARVGSNLRIPMTGGGAFFAGGHYLHILSAGDILVPEKYFKGSAVGGELGAGIEIPLGFAKGFDLSVGIDFRRIAFAFTPNKNPVSNRIAGGAVDQYIGLNLGLGYNIGL